MNADHDGPPVNSGLYLDGVRSLVSLTGDGPNNGGDGNEKELREPDYSRFLIHFSLEFDLLLLFLYISCMYNAEVPVFLPPTSINLVTH